MEYGQGDLAELNAAASSWCTLPEKAEWLWNRLESLSGSNETKSVINSCTYEELSQDLDLKRWQIYTTAVKELLKGFWKQKRKVLQSRKRAFQRSSHLKEKWERQEAGILVCPKNSEEIDGEQKAAEYIEKYQHLTTVKAWHLGFDRLLDWPSTAALLSFTVVSRSAYSY